MSTDLAQQVSEVPRKYETGHKSTACLLKDAGFPGIRKELCVAQVEVALTEVSRPGGNVVQAWS